METLDPSPDPSSENKKGEATAAAPSSKNTFPFDLLPKNRLMAVPTRILEERLLTGNNLEDIPLTEEEMRIMKKSNPTREQLAGIRKEREEEIEKKEPGEETYNNTGAYELDYDQDTGKIIKEKKPEVSSD